jgi:HEPN domain-containing protein
VAGGRFQAAKGLVINSTKGAKVNRAADWLKMAERDLGYAELGAASGYHEGAAFHAQQSAEKAVNALVQSLHGAVRGHAITEMVRQLPLKLPAEILNAAQQLDRVYVTSRYPNGFASGSPSDYFNEKDSRELIAYARQILEWCRSQIP